MVLLGTVFTLLYHTSMLYILIFDCVYLMEQKMLACHMWSEGQRLSMVGIHSINYLLIQKLSNAFYITLPPYLVSGSFLTNKQIYVSKKLKLYDSLYITKMFVK